MFMLWVRCYDVRKWFGKLITEMYLSFESYICRQPTHPSSRLGKSSSYHTPRQTQSHHTPGSNMHTLYIVCILIDWILVPWLHLTDSELYSTQGILHSILCSCLLLRLRGAYESLSEKGFLSIRLQSTLASASIFVSENSLPLGNVWFFSTSSLTDGKDSSTDGWMTGAYTSTVDWKDHELYIHYVLI